MIDLADLSPPRLAVRGVGKRFGQFIALEDVSLQLARGEIRALCGGNGAGKSTLMKILSGVIRPSEGTITIDGRLVEFRSPIDAQRAGLALVAQELSLAPDLSIHDNLWLGHASAPMRRQTGVTGQKARSALASVGLDHLDLATKVRALSIAERQLLEIARGLVRNASLLILDEPTATLSDSEISRVFDAVRALKARGCSVIFITHRMGEVYQLCDTVTVLRNGRLIVTEPVAAMPRESLLELMLGRKLTDIYPRHSTQPGDEILTVRGLAVPGVVHGVSLEAHAGQILGVVGQIGSGAIETVRALAGLAHDAIGEVRVHGATLKLGSAPAAAASGVRFVSEDRAEEGIFLHLPAGTNLVATRLADAAAQGGFLRPASLRKAAVALASQVGFDTQRLDMPASTLSGGNQQKLAVGRCANRNTAGVILMNEPTRGVDMGARAEIYQMLRRFCDEGNAIVLASTDIEEVIGLVDRVVTLYRGRIVGTHQHPGIVETTLLSEITRVEAAP
jgi:ABC-type sugar transport system ATPase subunit